MGTINRKDAGIAEVITLFPSATDEQIAEIAKTSKDQ